MGKYVTCISRDATAFFEAIADGELEYPLSLNTDARIAGWELCQNLLADKEFIEASEIRPMMALKSFVRIGFKGEKLSLDTHFWVFKNRVYNEHHDEDFPMPDRELLVIEEYDRERRHFEGLRAKFAKLDTSESKRTKIPSEVRIFVWQRDSGRCVECGSNEYLEYDHIIPFSKGGSNTERNIQLLCANCNRLKSDRIQ
jgi:hypothetical protein